MQKPLLSFTLVLFGALTAVALLQHGYLGILIPHFMSTAGGQVLADLVIALTLVLFWLVRDAKRTGRSALPWVVLTLVAGSFGPLLYLLTRKGETTAVAR
jgi:Terpene cyclase DEP1